MARLIQTDPQTHSSKYSHQPGLSPGFYQLQTISNLIELRPTDPSQRSITRDGFESSSGSAPASGLTHYGVTRVRTTRAATDERQTPADAAI